MKTVQPIGSPQEWKAYIANLALGIEKTKNDIYKECKERTPNITKLLIMKNEYQFLSRAMERCHSDYQKVQTRWKIATAEYRAIQDEVEEILRSTKNSTSKKTGLPVPTKREKP